MGWSGRHQSLQEAAPLKTHCLMATSGLRRGFCVLRGRPIGDSTHSANQQACTNRAGSCPANTYAFTPLSDCNMCPLGRTACAVRLLDSISNWLIPTSCSCNGCTLTDTCQGGQVPHIARGAVAVVSHTRRRYVHTCCIDGMALGATRVVPAGIKVCIKHIGGVKHTGYRFLCLA